MLMAPGARIHLDRRIIEERMIELDVHGSPPALGIGSHVTRIYTMDASGELARRWEFPDCVSWGSAAAFRAENWAGAIVDPFDDPDDDDFDY